LNIFIKKSITGLDTDSCRIIQPRIITKCKISEKTGAMTFDIVETVSVESATTAFGLMD
jgi:hypothetical protein